MKGEIKNPMRVDLKDIITGFIGCVVTISILVWLTNITSALWLMAPFGASCVLVFNSWDAPLSQPRNIIGGHFISSLVGLITYHLIGDSPEAISIAVGLSIAGMMLTKTTHPPAGANPIAVMMGMHSWSFLFTPVLLGSVLIVLVALVLNNLRSSRTYPTFWI